MTAAEPATAPPLRLATKLFYAVGSTATNLKLRALSTFSGRAKSRRTPVELRAYFSKIPISRGFTKTAAAALARTSGTR